MRILGVCWVGTRTAAHDETVAFLGSVLGLPVTHVGDGFTVLDVPGGATVEVFGPDSPYNAHLEAPVVGFLVEDLAAAEAELRAAGTPIVLPRTGGPERSWLHLRAPDGHLYELVQDAELAARRSG